MNNSKIPIPDWDERHLLPADLPPHWEGSPYRANLTEVIARFGHTAERRRLLAGLIRYRRTLRSIGFTRGFQWIGGSFVDDVETREGRPPNDIDTFFFLHSPPGIEHELQLVTFLAEHAQLFDKAYTKPNFLCDGGILPLDGRWFAHSAESHVLKIAEHAQLYSRARSNEIRGFIQLGFESLDDDRTAEKHLASGGR